MSQELSLSKNLLWKANGQIWKVFIDPYHPLIGLELRDGNLQQVRFVAIKTSGKVVLSETELGDWWTGAHSLVNKKLFLFEYGDLKYPEAQSLSAYDVSSKEVLWKKEGWQYEGADLSRVMARKAGDEIETAIFDTSTGKAMQDSKMDSPRLFAKFPTRYLEETTHHQTIAKFLSWKLGNEPIGGIDYLEINQKILVSHQQGTIESNQLFLSIFNKDGSLQFQTCLAANQQGQADERFFVVEDFVFFIEEKQKLYNLALRT